MRSQLKKGRHRVPIYNEVTFSPYYDCKPPWLWKEDGHGFLKPRFRRMPKCHGVYLWHEMNRDLWLAELALKDAAITFAWVTLMSLVGVGAGLVTEDLKLDNDMSIVFVGGALFAILPMFVSLSTWMGGACWNITSLVAFACMAENYHRHNILLIFIRLMAQMVSAVYAAVFVMKMCPPHYWHMVGGPTLQVDPFKGVLVEGILSYILVLVSLMNVLRGPNNPRVKTLISVVSTVMLVILGGAYTGPSMNPTCCYGWAVVNQHSEKVEHYVVYWFGPLVGTMAAVKTMKWLSGQNYKNTCVT